MFSTTEVSTSFFKVSDSSVRKVSPLLQQLGPKKPFFNFDLELSKEEEQCLHVLTIDGVSHYENYGNLEVLQEETELFISSLGEGNSKISTTISQLVLRIVNNTLNLTGQETAWITMRAFTPVTTFRTPRWHADRYDYPPTGEQYKAAVTLKGPSTIFYDASEKERSELDNIKFDREKLHKALKQSQIISAKFGEGTFFVIGCDYAPFHSEPDTRVERLFLTLVPGNKDQILGLYNATPEQELMPLLNKYDIYCYFVGPKLKDTFFASPYENTEIIIFKLLDNEEPELLVNLASIIMQNNKNIKAEVLIDERKLLQCTFSQGGVITLEDISDIFLKEKSRIKSEQDIFTVLKEYADGKIGPKQASSKADTLSNNQNSATPVVNQKRFSFNAIHGRNTSGLFKPMSNINCEPTFKNEKPKQQFSI